MVQRKVPSSKLGIQAEHVKSDKHLANLKLSSSQHQDGKTRGADMKKKMRKSRSIKLSDLETLQSSSSPSRRSLSQPGKPPPPLHVPTTSASASPQKQHHPLVRTTDGSPNYMKPTSSSHAKKELFPVSHRNPQSGSDFKNLPRKFSSDSKATCVSSKKPAKASLSLVRTLTKTTSFKASRACPKKSTRAAMCAADIKNAPHRATCSSTLKDSKFPAYLMLNPGGTESEGTSMMKVCPYTYCSLNGHDHADLPPLKSFISSKRRLLKTQKRMKVEALSPRRLKVPHETKKKDSEIEQSVFDAKPTAYDEIDMDIFIEIYANEKDANPTAEEAMGKIDFLKEIEDQEDVIVKPTIEEKGITIMQIIPSIADTPSPHESQIELEEDLETFSDDLVVVEADTKGSFLQEQIAEEDPQPSWSHEEMSMGSYCNDEEHMDDSDSKADSMEWEEEQFYGFDRKEDADSKIETLSESSHDVSGTWLDDILSTYYEGILVDEMLKEAKLKETPLFEEQLHDGISSVLEDISGSNETQETGYPSSDMGCDQSSLTEEVFEYLTNAEDNGGENEELANCNMEEFDDNSQYQEVSETCKIDETKEDRSSSQENNDDNSNSEENQIHLMDEESNITGVQDQGKGNKFQGRSCIGGEEQNTGENWKIGRKRQVEEDDDEMRKFNPKDPNYLPLVPEPEAEKVDLRHQMMDERKNAEEWMLDCALRQVVTKLAPARKKKVALLVEAFETVMPIPKCDTHLRNNSAFAHSRHIQACS